MAVLNYADKEINAKIVYYGPGLSGKTTNIQFIHAKLKPAHRGDLMTLSTEQDRTLFFDFLPVELGEVKGLKTRFHIYTVPGQVFYNTTRKMVLKDADGVVFVADSQRKYFNENVQSLENLIENLAEYNRQVTDLPVILQYNKRDLPDICTVAELNKVLNRYNFPIFEAVASDGIGVLQTLTTISKKVLRRLREITDLSQLEEEAPGGDPLESESAEEIELGHSLQAESESGDFMPEPEGGIDLDNDELKALDMLGPPGETDMLAEETAAFEEPTIDETPHDFEEPVIDETPPPDFDMQFEDNTEVADAAELYPDLDDVEPDGDAEDEVASAYPVALRVAAVGEAQLADGNEIRLPLSFIDEEGGVRYSTLLSIRIDDLLPNFEEEE